MSERTHGPFIPPRPEKGDPNTIGGYIAVHDRPAAFEGSDGASYSVEIVVDATGERERPYGAYFLFLRWGRSADARVEGHLETAFLEYGPSPEEARALLGGMMLSDVKRELDRLIELARAAEKSRPWWEAMRDGDAS